MINVSSPHRRTDRCVRSEKSFPSSGPKSVHQSYAMFADARSGWRNSYCMEMTGMFALAAAGRRETTGE